MKLTERLLGLGVFIAILLLSLRIYCPGIWVNTHRIQSMDPNMPYHFDGKTLVFQDKVIELGPNTFFVDGNMSRSAAKILPYAYNDLKKALKELPSGTEKNPSIIYIAPNVYWIDDPDDPEVRRPIQGGTPFGMMLDQEWIRLYGLTDKPENVVIACNRGQTQGAVGNFTMFHFSGDGISCENLTMGNYCNVDLVFPLDESLNRPKRMEAITQAQLVICQSDKVYAKNCSFISRLNSCPFVGAKRAVFENCHFECTDDALCGHGVYLNCDLDFYSSKPFWSTHGTGAAFMNCDFNIISQNAQYLTKVGSPVALIDCRFTHPTDDLVLEWTKYPKPSLRCYQHNLTLNGKEVMFHASKPEHTVQMEGKDVLNAYKFDYQGKSYYNIYGLVRQNDDWDPLHQKDLIAKASAAVGKDLSSEPTLLRISSSANSIESGVSRAYMKADVFRFYDVPVEEEIIWTVEPKYQHLVRLIKRNDSVFVAGTNYDESPKNFLLKASTKSGLEAAYSIEIRPKTLPAPTFAYAPYIVRNSKGNYFVKYQLNNAGRADQSAITWYRCTDEKGSHAIPVAVSRMDVPEMVYTPGKADVGYYLMAEVSPKNIRSQYGPSLKAVTKEAVKAEDVVAEYAISTDFRNFPCQYQPEIKEGFWTVDTYKPADTHEYKWDTQTSKTWYYGKSQDGAVGYGLLQDGKGARLLYTPIAGKYQDMSIKLWVDPCKTAGQGFGSATGQYMDIFIKYDTKTLSGYGLRIIRTTKYANAVDFILMQYENGQSKEISEAVSATCYRTNCHIDLKVVGNTLSADVFTETQVPEHPAGLPKEVHLKKDIETNVFGGLGIQHTGSTGSSATMLHQLDVQWN